jgi:hypothetical protein
MGTVWTLKLGPVFLVFGLLFLGLGISYSKLEWAVSGVLLIVLAGRFYQLLKRTSRESLNANPSAGPVPNSSR